MAYGLNEYLIILKTFPSVGWEFFDCFYNYFSAGVLESIFGAARFSYWTLIFWEAGFSLFIAFILAVSFCQNRSNKSARLLCRITDYSSSFVRFDFGISRYFDF